MVNLSKTIAILSTAILLGSCGCLHHLPPAENNVNVKDSLVINYRDSTIFHHKTVNKDYTGLLDTLRIQGEHSSMKAYADTSKFMINGELTEEPFKERIVYKDKIHYKDSIQYVKEPYPVEVVKEKKVVPKWCWWLLVFVLLESVVYAVKIYLKISKVDISSLLKKR